MAQQNKKQPIAKTGLARCLELASGIKVGVPGRVFGGAGCDLFFCSVLINLLHHSGNPVCLPGYVALECFHDFDLGMADPGLEFGNIVFTFLPCCVPTLRRLERFMN